MTDDKNPNINPKFYFSEIKTLEPILFNKGEPNTEVMTFRSQGKNSKQLLNLLLNQLLIIILLELPIIILKIEPIIIPLINQKLLLELIIEE